MAIEALGKIMMVHSVGMDMPKREAHVTVRSQSSQIRPSLYLFCQLDYSAKASRWHFTDPSRKEEGHVTYLPPEVARNDQGWLDPKARASRWSPKPEVNEWKMGKMGKNGKNGKTVCGFNARGQVGPQVALSNPWSKNRYSNFQHLSYSPGLFLSINNPNWSFAR